MPVALLHLTSLKWQAKGVLQLKVEKPISAVAMQLFSFHLLITVSHSLGASIFHISCWLRKEKV